LISIMLWVEGTYIFGYREAKPVQEKWHQLVMTVTAWLQ